jgi:hypothetical protein
LKKIYKKKDFPRNKNYQTLTQATTEFHLKALNTHLLPLKRPTLTRRYTWISTRWPVSGWSKYQQNTGPSMDGDLICPNVFPERATRYRESIVMLHTTTKETEDVTFWLQTIMLGWSILLLLLYDVAIKIYICFLLWVLLNHCARLFKADERLLINLTMLILSCQGNVG